MNSVVLHRALRLLLGISIALAITFVTYAYASMQNGIALKTEQGVCITGNDAASICFASPGKLLATQETIAIATSPDGRLLANSWQNVIQVWDLETETLMRSLQGHTHWITALAFSPDGRTIASSSLDGTIRLWDVETSILTGVLHSGRMTCLAFSPSGLLLASGSRTPRWADGEVSPTGAQVWGMVTKEWLYSVGNQPISALTFSPDGRFLAGGSTKTQVWKVPAQVRKRTLDSGELTSLAFTQDGQTLITGSSKVKLWDANTGKLLHTLKSRSSYLFLSPDQQTLATVNGGMVNLWDVATKRLYGTLRGSWFSRTTALFALNGEAIVTGSSDGLRFWRAQVDRPLPLPENPEPTEDAPEPEEPIADPEAEVVPEADGDLNSDDYNFEQQLMQPAEGGELPHPPSEY